MNHVFHEFEAYSFEVKKQIIDGYIIAEMELKQKKLPFIVQRPLPNGGCEYWPLQELEILI